MTETHYTDARGDHHELNLVYAVSTTGVDATSQEAHIGFRWIHERDLAELEIRPAPIAQALRGGLTGPGLPLLSEGFDQV